MDPGLEDHGVYSCPPLPQAMPLPLSFPMEPVFADLQQETPQRLQPRAPAHYNEMGSEAIPSKQERTGAVYLHAQQGELDNNLDNLAFCGRKISRPPKHIREESKRIALVIHQMLATSAPMRLIKERLNCMMQPLCRDQKNIHYTMSVLRAVCNDYNDILEMIVGGEENTQASATENQWKHAPQEIGGTASSDGSHFPRLTKHLPPYEHVKNGTIAGWSSSPSTGMATVLLRWSV